MHNHEWQIAPMGEAALLIECFQPDAQANQAIHSLKIAIQQQNIAGINSIIPGIASLLVHYNHQHISYQQLSSSIWQLKEQISAQTYIHGDAQRLIRIPVVYGGEHGPDLLTSAAELGISPKELIAAHCGQIYRVMMIGFAPGFPYIGPLPSKLNIPRRSTPRSAVPAGSVAIAAGLTGIYPAKLPGGWHILGRTPLQLFNPQQQPPSLLQAGDGVQFEPLPEGLQP
jgi:KipI family sensor histidine kinase inhibitor